MKISGGTRRGFPAMGGCSETIDSKFLSLAWPPSSAPNFGYYLPKPNRPGMSNPQPVSP
jgi:hypothetical protein